MSRLLELSEIKEKEFPVQQVRDLTNSAYVLRFNKNEMKFKPGQYITLGLEGDTEVREYSVYSPDNVDYLEVLIKEVSNGRVSRQLRNCNQGDKLKFEGPFGYFTIDKEDIYTKKFLFVATGTGISPFHSIVGSYSGLDYTIIHGVRYGNEAYESETYDSSRYTLCTSRDNKGHFYGRVTDYLLQNEFDKKSLVYICGNSHMIDEVFKILETQGFETNQFHAEVYF